MTNPAHEEITQRARQIWEDRGRPSGSDDEIWMEAERQLNAAVPSSKKGLVKNESEHRTEDQGVAAMKAEAQKKEARAPKMPTKSAPKAKPAESGKPVWDKPHSS